MLNRTAELCWSTEVARLESNFHNSTLVNMSDYIVKLYNTTYVRTRLHVFNSKQ